MLGPVIAASRGAAHFIPLPRQFHEKLALALAFSTLIHRAHVAFRLDNPFLKALVDEAFSPQVLQQLRAGWYLPVIKSIVGVHSSGSTKLPASEPWSQMRIETLKALFLRYGTDLLDTIHEKKWVQKRGEELRQRESRVLEQFAALASPLYKTQLDRGTQTIESRNISITLEAPSSNVPPAGEWKAPRSLRFWAIILSLYLLNISIGIKTTILTNVLPTIT